MISCAFFGGLQASLSPPLSLPPLINRVAQRLKCFLAHFGPFGAHFGPFLAHLFDLGSEIFGANTTLLINFNQFLALQHTHYNVGACTGTVRAWPNPWLQLWCCLAQWAKTIRRAANSANNYALHRRAPQRALHYGPLAGKSSGSIQDRLLCANQSC